MARWTARVGDGGAPEPTGSARTSSGSHRIWWSLMRRIDDAPNPGWIGEEAAEAGDRALDPDSSAGTE